MSDSRSFNFQRRRRWGSATLKLALLNNEAHRWAVRQALNLD